MSRFRWTLLAGLALALSSSMDAQVNSVTVAPPLGALTPPASATFLSPNRKYKLVLEEATLAPTSGPRTVQLNASVVEEVGQNRVVHWAASFDGPPLQSSFSAPDAILSNDASFFVLIGSNGGHVWLCTKDFQRRLDIGGQSTSSGLFLTLPENLVFVDTLKGEKVVRVWLRDKNSWEAFRISTGEKVWITPQIAADWNARTRLEVLDLLHADKRERLRRRISKISAPVAKLAGAGLGSAAVPPRHVHYEFLTLQRKSEDRHWVEEVALGESSRLQPLGAFTPWQPFAISGSDDDRIRGDWLLAMWDKIITNGMRPFSREWIEEIPRFNLGKVSGKVRFALPLNIYPSSKLSVLHVHLIKEGASESAEHLSGSMESGASTKEADVICEASFSFGTVLPGAYRLKAIWDKRAPFVNDKDAGPGDYEGELAQTIVVTAGGSVSNLVLECTNRVAGGEAYYQADQWIATNWRAGRISRFTFFADSEGRMDIMTRPASDWIVRTNLHDLKDDIQMATIGLRTEKKVSGQELQHGDELVITLRRTSERARQFLPPPQLVIKDEHGCVYPSKSVRDGDLIGYTFWIFPRSAPAWRIVISQKEPWVDLETRTLHLEAQTIFDAAVTNLVRVAARELPVRRLPIELDLGDVVMKVAFAGIEFRSPSIAARFFENGKENDAWQILEARVADVHGNFIGAREMCRAEKNVTIVGRVGKGPGAPKTLPFEFSVPRDTTELSAR